MLHTAKYMNQILNHSMEAYEEIFQEIDTTNLLEQKGIVEGACHQHGIHHLQRNSGGYEDMETCLADWLNSPFYRDTG